MDFTRVIENKKINKLWCDKYAPNSLEKIYGNREILQPFYNSIKKSKDGISSLLINGPHGCGKSTIARLIAKELLGNHYSKNLMQIYSSISRNKTYVNNKCVIDNKNINDFINRTNKELKLKIIIVYDIDTTNYETQEIFCELLRYNHVRIIFTCNNIDTLCNNILSSVMTVMMSLLTYDEIYSIITSIEKSNNMNITEDLKNALCITCNGDIKTVFNIMQLLSGIKEKEITSEKFYKLVDIPSYECVKSMIIFCCNQDISAAYKKLKEILSNGYDIRDIVNMIEKTLLYIDTVESNITEDQYVKMLETVTYYLIFRPYTKIQIFNMISKMAAA